MQKMRKKNKRENKRGNVIKQGIWKTPFNINDGSRNWKKNG